jgi:hypothetical protein
MTAFLVLAWQFLCFLYDLYELCIAIEEHSCFIEYFLKNTLLLSPCSWPRATLGGIVAAARLRATIDVYVIKSEILTASISTKNVIIGGSRDHPPCDIGESDVGRKDPIRCYARRSAVKVVLLDIYTKSFDI